MCLDAESTCGYTDNRLLLWLIIEFVVNDPEMNLLETIFFELASFCVINERRWCESLATSHAFPFPLKRIHLFSNEREWKL